jgi:hypothetical protein
LRLKISFLSHFIIKTSSSFAEENMFLSMIGNNVLSQGQNLKTRRKPEIKRKTRFLSFIASQNISNRQKTRKVRINDWNK